MKPHLNVTKDRNRSVVKASKKRQDKPWVLEEKAVDGTDWKKVWFHDYISVEHALQQMNKLNRSVYTASGNIPVNIYMKKGFDRRLVNVSTKEIVELTIDNNNDIIVKV